MNEFITSSIDYIIPLIESKLPTSAHPSWPCHTYSAKSMRASMAAPDLPGPDLEVCSADDVDHRREPCPQLPADGIP